MRKKATYRTYMVLDTKKISKKGKLRRIRRGFKSLADAATYIGHALAKRDPQGVDAGRYAIDSETHYIYEFQQGDMCLLMGVPVIVRGRTIAIDGAQFVPVTPAKGSDGDALVYAAEHMLKPIEQER